LLGEEEPELIATQSPDHIAGAGTVAQEAGDLPDELIAHEVAVAVIDRLQPTNVEVGQRERPVMPAGTGELSLNLRAESAPVQNAG
jgi:hypothetical protein